MSNQNSVLYISVTLLAAIITITIGLIAIFSSLGKIDVSGHWLMISKVTESSYNPYVKGKLECHYLIFLKQTGSDIEGSGEKYAEIFHNKRYEYSGKGKTAIYISGKIKGKKIIANIIEEGVKRKSSGQIEINLKTLNGHFKTTAANSFGNITIERIEK